MGILNGLEPERVFYYFEKISQIPRCSYNEQKIKNLGLETIQDENLNVIIKKPASKGYENSKGVVIQGHMDMVCEKEEKSDHNFAKDPIELVVDNDFIYANKTTLGADNGIAIAMGLAILEDKDLEHPPIEFLATVAEEVEMDGAFGLSEDALTGRRYLNIDSEEEGTLVMGSAGGELIEINLPLSYEETGDYVKFNITVKGLMGGHSGMDIDKPRANSNKIINEIFKDIGRNIDFRIISIDGGTKDNAISRQTTADIGISKSMLDSFNKSIKTIKEKITDKLKNIEPGIKIEIENLADVKKVLSQKDTQKIISLIENIHTGVYSKVPDNEDIVESSSNLAIINIKEDKLCIQVSTRSSDPKVLGNLREKILDEAKKVGANYKISNQYPEWKYRQESELRDIALKVYKKMYKKDMKTSIIHAGLECGVISNKYPDMDIISFGPDIYDAHTPKERLSISSTQRVYKYIIKLLRALK